MEPKVVFFGEANHGKSTVIGFLYAELLNINMDKVERGLKERIGTDYDPCILYSSLINSDVIQRINTEEVKEIEYTPNLKEGTKFIKNTEDEQIIETTCVIGNRAKVITKTHRKRFIKGLNSIAHHLRNIQIDDFGEPIKITVIDTPGHVGFLPGREIGMSMGDIGVFCLEIKEVLDDDFSGFAFEYPDLFSQYNEKRKLIYLLTKFDDAGANSHYTEADYDKACRRIKKYCKRVTVEARVGLGEIITAVDDDIAAIIPVAVKPKERCGINLIAHNDMTSWYKGSTLIEAIKEQVFEVANSSNPRSPNNLLFSIDKEIPNPRSQAGKVWRVNVKNGCLKVDDKVKITSVSLKGHPKTSVFDVEATVKAIREELSVYEEDANTEVAYTGSIVTIDLKACYANGKKIDKGDIISTYQSYGISINEPVTLYDAFDIRFADIEKAFDVIREGQEVLLLWFGKRTPATITKIPDTLEGMFVRLKHGKKIAIPTNPDLRNLDAIKSIKMLTQYGNERFLHFSGYLEFESEESK